MTRLPPRRVAQRPDLRDVAVQPARLVGSPRLAAPPHRDEPAPLSDASGETEPRRSAAPADSRQAEASGGARGWRTRDLPLARSPWALLAVLALSLFAYAAIATDVVHDGPLSSRDNGVSDWIARSMPTWAEWLARPFSWVGGAVGITIIATLVVVRRAWRGERAVAVLVAAVTAGGQLLSTFAKTGYDRPRPTVGSPVGIPSSSSFPSGHATTIALFGLLGLIVACGRPTRGSRTVAIAAGFALGALIGASRVVLNVHFVTDVLGGFAFGLAWLATCLLAAVLLDRRRRR